MIVQETGPLHEKKLALFAISDADYAAMSLTMFDSVRKFYPDADFFLFIIGTGETTKLDGNITVIYIADVLDDLDLSQRLVHYLQVELVTSVRPQCVEFLFAKQYERAIYLDPDIYVFRRMTEVDELLDGDCNGVVTAHALKSISDGAFEGGDNVFLKCGIFNMGFLALKNTPETRRMLAWWKSKLKWKCIVDWPNGYFVDQKWLEFLPVYFDGFHILKSPTYNLAPWNAEHYHILSDFKGNFYVDDYDTPVAFIHYSGIKRSEAHFQYMKDARSFYLKELQKRRFEKLDFANYELRFKGMGLPFDKVCTFLYKDYVRKTKDEKSNPLEDRWFYEYIHSTDEETGFPVYIRKLYEIMPNIFVGYLSTQLGTNWDNIIWLVKNHFNYDSVVSLETMIQLRDSQPRLSVTAPNSGNDSALTSSAYGQAVLSFSSTVSRDDNPPSQKVTFKPDRIEIESDSIRVCIPELDASGNLPAGLDLRSQGYSEIWVPSIASKEKLAKEHGLKNVTPILAPVIKPNLTRASVSLPQQAFVVLLRHELDQDFGAQDPLASIHAFQEAFGDDPKAILVCFIGGAANPSDRKRLVSAASAAENILIADETDAPYSSYLNRCNCFISLHQEAAVGSAVAEAMSIGKEVIATSAGVSSHYLNADNSFSIDPVSATAVIEQAADALREIFEGVDAVGLRGQKAKFYVRKHLSVASVGFAMQNRIEELHKMQMNSREHGSSIAARISRKLRRIKNRLSPQRTAAAALPPSIQGSAQTDAIIKILLKNVIRPDIME